MLKVGPDHKYALVVLTMPEGVRVYKQMLDAPIEAWCMSTDRLVYMESLASKKITLVKLSPNKGECVEHFFMLPDDVKV